MIWKGGPPQKGGPTACARAIRCPGICGLVHCKLVESGAQAFEASAKSGGIAANANPEMPGHLKKFSGDNGGLIFLAEQFEKGLRIAAR